MGCPHRLRFEKGLKHWLEDALHSCSLKNPSSFLGPLVERRITQHQARLFRVLLQYLLHRWAESLAQFETDVRRERQAEGIARVIADPKLRREKYPGGKQRIDRARVVDLKQAGHGPAAIARTLGISRMSVCRALRKRMESRH